MASKRRLLDGLKVLDFTWAIAGPSVTKYLSDQGATVVRVESIKRVDAIRTFQPYKDGKPGINRSSVWTAMNSGKYSIALNMNLPESIEVAKRLVGWCDVVVENYAPGAMDNWGLGYDALTQLNEDIIMLSMSSMGQTGPYAHYHGLGFHLQGFCGFCHVTGFPDRDPFGAIPYTDFTGPPLALSAVMGALDRRRRTGKGLFIDMSQVEAAVDFLGPAVLNYTANGQETNRVGNASSRAAPHGAYACKGNDRWCVIAVFTDAHWHGFRDGIGSSLNQEAWAQEARFQTLLGRLEHIDDLNAHVEAWTREHTPEEVMETLQAKGVPAGMVEDGKDLAEDRQFAHRAFFQHFEHVEIGDYMTRRSPALFSDADSSVPRVAPILGQNTEYVCTELLGMADDEWIALMEKGVFV